MSRIDHCNNLIHFTKGTANKTDYEQAYQTLKKITKDLMILGGNGMILGQHICICFTEAPAKCLTNEGQLNRQYFSRYTPFGIQLSKKTVYNHGGRPVIYSSRAEWFLNKDNKVINWKYVSYDPNENGALDFTWEREWRGNINQRCS